MSRLHGSLFTCTKSGCTNSDDLVETWIPPPEWSITPVSPRAQFVEPPEGGRLGLECDRRADRCLKSGHDVQVDTQQGCMLPQRPVRRACVVQDEQHHHNFKDLVSPETSEMVFHAGGMGAHLLFDPGIRHGDAFAQSHPWLEAERLDSRVAEVTGLHADRPIYMANANVLAGRSNDNGHELVHCDVFPRADVCRLLGSPTPSACGSLRPSRSHR